MGAWRVQGIVRSPVCLEERGTKVQGWGESGNKIRKEDVAKNVEPCEPQ